MRVQTGEIEQLRELAREHWGEEFRIVVHHWEDGDVDRFAEHQLGIVDEDECGQINGRERLFLDPDSDGYVIQTEHFRKDPEVVDLERVEK